MKLDRSLAALAAVAFIAGCSDSAMTGPTGDGAPAFGVGNQVQVQAVPTPAQVVVPGTPAGAFTNTIVANNSIRTTTEFWDNNSADDPLPSRGCNIGFYATGTILSTCENQFSGSHANAGGFTKYFGDGAEGEDATSFMFNGDFEYNVTLVGAYHALPSEVGWFTKVGTTYTFHPITNWGNSVIGTAITINTGGADWGFYIANNFNSQTGGCLSPTHDCSDANGGFTTVPFQQFALMVNAAGTAYMVGTEDNQLELSPGAFPLDSDYNDYIFVIEPVAEELLNGRMTGGGGTVTATSGVTVTYGFTLHCDITLSNNLELNWAGGNKWHLDKPITLARCEDDPAIEPHPPVAPFDTFHGEGIGRLNGVDGSRIEFTLVDDGEGSNSGDKARFTIYAPNSNTVVLTVNLQLTTNGNIQAHYDQPHGQKP